jgi:hypothetical protein
MANILVNDKVKLSGAFNIASAATTYEFIADEVCDVYRAAFIPTTSATGSGSIDIIKRDVVGTGSTVLETWVVGAVAAGKYNWHDIVLPVAQSTGIDGSLVDVDPAGPIHLVPGQSILFDVNVAAGAGTGYLAVYYWADGLAESNQLEGVTNS